MIIHVVEPGDSLYKIGQEYGVSPYRLAIDNGIEYNSTLVIGQTIVVQYIPLQNNTEFLSFLFIKTIPS